MLSRYVGWGGIPEAFDESKEAWADEFKELYATLSPEEYREARASTLNAFYTSPTVIKAMYKALENMGLASGNVLEPSCGIGNFMGLVPEESMSGLRMYGVELDSISGKIAKQLYQKNQISVQGFETTQLPYMVELCGKTEDEIIKELTGVIFKNPLTDRYETSDAYLSGNVRDKLRVARQFAEADDSYSVNVAYLEKVQPKDLDASEIEVRLGATWVKPAYIQQFMGELFLTPWYLLGRDIQVKYAEVSGQWNISGKTRDSYGNLNGFSLACSW